MFIITLQCVVMFSSWMAGYALQDERGEFVRYELPLLLLQRWNQHGCWELIPFDIRTMKRKTYAEQIPRSVDKACLSAKRTKA